MEMLQTYNAAYYESYRNLYLPVYFHVNVAYIYCRHHKKNYLRQDGGHAHGLGPNRWISTYMETLVDLHNEARCLHNADHLIYTRSVVASATNSCGQLFHSASEDRNGYGENLYLCARSGSESCYTPEGAMAALYESEVQVDSVKDYGLHATQILWKSTTEMGCGQTSCSLGSLNYVYLVCQYDPPGNVNLSTRLESEVGLPTGTNC